MPSACGPALTAVMSARAGFDSAKWTSLRSTGRKVTDLPPLSLVLLLTTFLLLTRFLPPVSAVLRDLGRSLAVLTTSAAGGGSR